MATKTKTAPAAPRAGAKAPRRSRPRRPVPHEAAGEEMVTLSRSGWEFMGHEAERSRAKLLAWWSRTLAEIRWVGDLLMRGAEPFKDSVTPEVRNELAIALDQAWHKMAQTKPLRPPAEFDD
ncbi:unnamed protein product [Gemmataceae bacterium]|nr:unnamed protein product [Gemmataceae bacterium]VTU02454.1 unnamed protein product [Gemmataceae bacterium]